MAGGSLGWLEAVGRRPQRPGPYSLELITELLDRLGRPQDAFRAVHVAGTRGKGSTCALIAAALDEAGLAAGLTTSPHLVDVTERIRIRERDATPAELERWLGRVRDAAEELEPSYFEAMVAAAFLAFAEARLPLAVVEVGLGGRLDATVLCRPAVTVITRLGLEHRDRLGETRAAIAREKAGILKPGVPAILAPNHPEAEAAVRERADEVGAPLRVLAPADLAAAPATGLVGSVQAENAAVAWAALEALRAVAPAWSVSRPQAERGFQAVRWAARLDLRRTPEGRPVLVDVAHDEESVDALCRHVETAELQPRAFVFTCLNDKDLPGLAHRLAASPALARARAIVPALAGHPRARPPDEVAGALRAAGLRASRAESVEAALQEALSEGGLVLAFGTFAVAGEVLRRLG